MEHPSIDLKRDAEAASYALLRRLAPAMAHQMAGEFQPVTILAAVIEKRLQAANVDLPGLVKASNDIRAMATAATRFSLDLLGWIASDTAVRVPLDKGIEEALHLVANELSLRGFKWVDQTQGVAALVTQSHLRSVFSAALLALTDAAQSPCNLLLAADCEVDCVAVTVTLSPFKAAPEASLLHALFRPGAAPYRSIDWHDVQAIAALHGVPVEHSAATLVVRLPIAS